MSFFVLEEQKSGTQHHVFGDSLFLLESNIYSASYSLPQDKNIVEYLQSIKDKKREEKRKEEGKRGREGEREGVGEREGDDSQHTRTRYLRYSLMAKRRGT